MYSKKGFTLVELIVWVTISMLLMVSIWMLVSSGMQNILKQQKIMNKNSLLSTTVGDFYNGFENITQSWWHIYSYNSWAIFKINQNISKWWFAYLWVSAHTNRYCMDDSEFPSLNYLTWKSFIPYEEIWEDIFDNFSDIESQTVTSGSTYIVDTINHQVLEDGIRIVWWDVYGHEINHGSSWLETRLNNPTWITLAEWGFFLSDTLNNRILFYQNWNIYLILDQSDGIFQPTWLFYHNATNSLYIANSWKWEILKLSSEILSNSPDVHIDFSPINDANSISRIQFEFPDFTGTLAPISTSDITSNNINHWTWYITINNNIVDFYFSDYRNISQPITNGFIPWCTDSDSYTLNWSTPERHIYTCSSTNTGTHQIHSGNIYQNMLSNSQYQIWINNITSDFSGAGTKLVNITLYNNSTIRYQDTFRYFTQWDGIINNLENTQLSVVITWLWYPTWLNITSANRLEINDFINREQYSYDLNDIATFNTYNLNDFSDINIDNIPFDNSVDTILENPIADININYNSVDKFLSNNITYYQYLNCYNPEEFSKKTIILQKNFD